MSDNAYQGWANRETWALMLHVNNDQALSETFREGARLNHEESGNVEEAAKDLAESVFTRQGWADYYGSEWPSWAADAAHEIGSLWRVDWSEVAAALLED
jgi:hypothetical protein